MAAQNVIAWVTNGSQWGGGFCSKIACHFALAKKSQLSVCHRSPTRLYYIRLYYIYAGWRSPAQKGLVMLAEPERQGPVMQRSVGGSHPVRRVLAEDKLETREVGLNLRKSKRNRRAGARSAKSARRCWNWEQGRFFRQVSVVKNEGESRELLEGGQRCSCVNGL